ncbi:MAG: hypothetical protein ACFFD1_04715 [Candidatus Thorarchaeota archaeon]
MSPDNSPVDKRTQVKIDLANFGVFGLYILTREGLPLVERNYKSILGGNQKEVTGLTFGSDTLLVAGFFSAIAKFATEKISGLLSDIGLHVLRLFFDFTEELIFILVFDELKLQELPFYEIRTMLKGTLSQVKSIFETYFGEDKEDGKPSDIEILSKNIAELERLRDSLTRLYPQIDRLIHKSYREVFSIITDEGTL